MADLAKRWETKAIEMKVHYDKVTEVKEQSNIQLDVEFRNHRGEEITEAKEFQRKEDIAFDSK